MGKYEEFYRARTEIESILRKDFIGPLEDNEVLRDSPIKLYTMARLFPMETENLPIENINAVEEYNHKDDDFERVLSLSASINPSSSGITFLLSEQTKTFFINYSYAVYDKSREQNDEGKYYEIWARKSYEGSIEVTIDEKMEKRYSLDSDAEIHIYKHIENPGEGYLYTATMLNSKVVANKNKVSAEDLLYQVNLKIELQEGSFEDVDLRNSHNRSTELLELEMLYSQKHCYAQGHGCSVIWDKINSFPQWVAIEYLPSYELFQMEAEKMDSPIFYIKNLMEDNDEIFTAMRKFVERYDTWIDSQEQLLKSYDSKYHAVGKENLLKCRKACKLMNTTIDALENSSKYNSLAWRAFKLANEAMLMQQCANYKKRYGKDASSSQCKWHPFQLAFILCEIYSFINPKSNARATVDLLWFPTGGGKTEAYLAIAAFTIILRRLQNCNDDGVTIIMRYTLRLLTMQQFERASAMIVACELLRQREKIGSKEISIGLWVGEEFSPNSIKDADAYLKGDQSKSNPAQLQRCPWCGKVLVQRDYAVDSANKRVIIRCSNTSCATKNLNNGLPIHMVDEAIYTHTPSFVISTIDKFAQLPMNNKTYTIFGKMPNGANKKPPELIIQDELHLLSGPLGTITGLYEVAITKFCEYNGIPVKILASTATIRNASEQIKALYGRTHTQFPPQGINCDDSFFAKLSTAENKPTRMYYGVMGAGVTHTSTFNKINAVLLYASRYLENKDYSPEVIDNYWTIVDYFNTIRELGAAVSMINEDIKGLFSYMSSTKYKGKYPLSSKILAIPHTKYVEASSRIPSAEISNVLAQLERSYVKSPEDARSFMLATNMISVGLDIGRLGIMNVYGQPKTNAEYIQATSRVGRQNPGIVVAQYNPLRSRDRSHYEQFQRYHSSLYKYVEANSLTPFSDRSMDRGLQALLVSFCRFFIDDLEGEEEAANFASNREDVKKIINDILEYVDKVDPAEHENVYNQLIGLSRIWNSLAEDKLNYKKTHRKNPVETLIKPSVDLESPFRMMNSMRSVEGMTNLFFDRPIKKSLLNVSKESPIMVGSTRASQVITTFGPGSINNFSGCGAMVKGINLWFGKYLNSQKPIVEQNLQKLLHKKRFFLPPIPKDTESFSNNLLPTMPAVRFPEWYFCPNCHRLDRYYKLAENKSLDKKELRCKACRKAILIPSSFLVACVNGHINDFPYDFWVHNGVKDEDIIHNLYFEFSGKTGGLDSYMVRCSCGKTRSLQDSMSENIFKKYKCRGYRPWLMNHSRKLTETAEDCCALVKTVFRNSANNYYSCTISALTIPHQNNNDIINILQSQEFINAIEYVTDEDTGKISEKGLTRIIKKQFKDFIGNGTVTVEQVLQEYHLLQKQDVEEYTEMDMRKDEYDVLVQGTLIDEKSNNYKAQKTTVPDIIKEKVEQIVLVTRLREVMALMGFRRIYPEYPDSEADQSDERFKGWNKKSYVPLSDGDEDWLPAVELLGEGIFIQFKAEKIREWENKNAYKYRKVTGRRVGNRSANTVSPRYYLLHTLAHMLIRQLTLDCGYSSAALKERIYSGEGMCGILIYTSATDSDGSLGGLVRMGREDKFSEVISNMLVEASWCSSDPVCSKSAGQGFMGTNFAACHACTLISETSCEANNCYLDRTSIIGELGNERKGFLFESC